MISILATRIRRNIALQNATSTLDNVFPPHPFPPPHICDIQSLAVPRSFLSVVRRTIFFFHKIPFSLFLQDNHTATKKDIAQRACR